MFGFLKKKKEVTTVVTVSEVVHQYINKVESGLVDFSNAYLLTNNALKVVPDAVLEKGNSNIFALGVLCVAGHEYKDAGDSNRTYIMASASALLLKKIVKKGRNSYSQEEQSLISANINSLGLLTKS